MSGIKVRPLEAHEIECRVNTVTKKGFSLLLYKDARCDMMILDELFTPFGWQRKHELINGKEFCTVSIKDAQSGEWISKQDCGTESNTAKEKGESSDAFKRACTNWGIGRELYTKLHIFIRGRVKEDGKDKWALQNKYERFRVTDIETDLFTRKIISLTIKDSEDIVVFTWPKTNDGNTGESNQAPEAPILCPKCGQAIKTVKKDNGVIVPPAMILKECGMCVNCYRAAGKENINA